MWMMPLHLHVNQKSDYDDMMIFYMKILLYKAANISTKRSFSSKKCDYKENGTDRNAA